jgi:ABC-type dipeptide/oligopeptide/nickel transport system permease subunit
LVKPLQWIDGEIHKAPFPPGNTFRLGTDELGRDLLSLLLYGARTTLILAFFATVLRLLLGLLLGTIAGWWPGSLFDRTVNAVSDFLAAIPGLILAMLVIFAVGIQKGHIAFVIGLSVVGVGEIAQIMRGHVITLRKEPYIEAARAVGLSSAGILSRHVLPNLLATLLALAALEMGAALLLLGELGFVNVFIGGGRVGFDMAAWETTAYFDVPDWGAMLGSTWRWFRSYPWLPLVAATAFFVSILGFNLFGYGLQRFVERGRFHPSGWSVIRFLAVTALILVGARSLLEGAGIEAQLARLVRGMNIERAWQDIAYLTSPEVQSGMAVSTPDGEVSPAAEYIAKQFEAAGLSYLEESYFQPYTAYQGRISAPAAIELSGNASQVVSGVSYDPLQAFQAQGTTEGELVIIGNVSRLASEGVLLMLNPDENVRVPWNTPQRYDAVVRLVTDEQLPPANQAPAFDNTSYLTPDRLPSFPNLLVGETAAHQLLEQAGLDLDELQTALEAGQEIEIETGLEVRLSYGLTYEELTAINVVGYVPGLDTQHRGERILLAASYADISPAVDTIRLGADVNASGVAVMLETARLLKDLEMIPKRTIVFAALDAGGGNQFVQDSGFPSGRSNMWTTVEVEGVGAGQSRLARAEAGSGLARAFDQSARRFRTRTEPLNGWPFLFLSGLSRSDWTEPTVHPSYQGLAVTRPGEDLSGTTDDTLAHLEPELLDKACKSIAHFVMVLGFR